MDTRQQLGRHPRSCRIIACNDAAGSYGRRDYYLITSVALALWSLELLIAQYDPSPPSTLTVRCALWTSVLIVFVALAFGYRIRAMGVALALLLVGIFPEYSQTNIMIRSSNQFSSLYNLALWKALTPFDLGVFFITLTWFVSRRRSLAEVSRTVVFKREVIVLVACLAFATMYGVLRGNTAYDLLKDGRSFAYIVLFSALGLDELSDKRAFDWLLGVLVLLGILRGIEGVTRYWLGIGMPYYGTHLVYFDVFDSIVIACSLIVMLRRDVMQPRWKDYAVYLLLSTGAFALLYSFRRTVWVALGPAIVVAMLRLSQWEWKTTFVRVVLCVAGLGILVVAAESGIAESGIAESGIAVAEVQRQVGASNTFRLFDTMNAFMTIGKEPLGVGLGGRYVVRYWSGIPQIDELLGHANKTCHNGYLHVWLKLGAIGLLAFFGLGWASLKAGLRALRTKNIRVQRATAISLAILALLAIANLFMPLTFNTRSSVFIGLVMGMLLALGKLPEAARAEVGPERTG